MDNQSVLNATVFWPTSSRLVPVYFKSISSVFLANHGSCYFLVQVPWRISVSLIMAAVNRFVITCVTWKSNAVAGLVTTSLMMPKPALVSNELLYKTSREGKHLVNIIVNRGKWLWNTTRFVFLRFCSLFLPWPCTRHNGCLLRTEELAN